MKVWRLTQCNLWCSSQVAPTNFLDNIWIYTFIFNADQFCTFWPYLKIFFSSGCLPRISEYLECHPALPHLSMSLGEMSRLLWFILGCPWVRSVPMSTIVVDRTVLPLRLHIPLNTAIVLVNSTQLTLDVTNLLVSDLSLSSFPFPAISECVIAGIWGSYVLLFLFICISIWFPTVW